MMRLRHEHLLLLIIAGLATIVPAVAQETGKGDESARGAVRLRNMEPPKSIIAAAYFTSLRRAWAAAAGHRTRGKS